MGERPLVWIQLIPLVEAGTSSKAARGGACAKAGASKRRDRAATVPSPVQPSIWRNRRREASWTHLVNVRLSVLWPPHPAGAPFLFPLAPCVLFWRRRWPAGSALQDRRVVVEGRSRAAGLRPQIFPLNSATCLMPDRLRQNPHRTPPPSKTARPPPPIARLGEPSHPT